MNARGVYFVRRMSSPTRHARLMELFDEGCELPRTQAKAWLESLTGFDAGLREELAAMLDVDGRSEVFHTRGAAGLLARDLLDSALEGSPKLPSAARADPTQLGEYEVLEKLGSGGMGSVYRARQKTPDRVVALKTLHPWLVSPAALERFRFEAQALASLTHPGIPPVYAVGQHEGIVYFAMELVEGEPLTTFAKSRALDLRARVELLANVAEAVHHAHLRGFVHRDLKPDNVRVTNDGTPKVLDFGIAAGLGQRRAEVAGTPAYMAPEQFDPQAGVDVRTDVYALGVMLFELLTGQKPIVPHGTALETLRALKQQPSPRLVSVDGKFGRELDAIVGRALEVSAEKRYASADALADDLRRWLAYEPVRAVGGGRVYRAGRFVRRNRGLVAALSLLVLALVAGASVSLWFFLDARAAARTAELEAQRAKTSAEFLANVFAEADSDNAGGRGATIGVALDHAVEKLEKQKIDPHVEAFLRSSLTNTYMGLGEWQHAKVQALAAAALYEREKMPDDEALSELLRVLAGTECEMGELKAGLAAAEKSLAMEWAFHGKGVHEHTAYSWHVMGIARRYANDVAGAIEAHQNAIAQERAILAATGSSYLVDALEQLCLTLVTFGRYDEARVPVKESLAMNEKQFGREHQVTMISVAHVGWIELNQGNLDEARKLFTEVNAVRKKLLGTEHSRYGQGLHNLAQVELEARNWDAAEPLLEEALRIAKKAYGTDSGHYAWLETRKVELLIARGKKEEALELANRDLALIEKQYVEDCDATVQALVVKAWAERALGRDASATVTRVKALAAKVYGVEKPLLKRQADAL
ncbi:MAG: serine/threonine protein kinase [Archangium sp.]|nr:serine/threonine protein kinase [Archangium sp.]